jgi:hypothetical protein
VTRTKTLGPRSHEYSSWGQGVKQVAHIHVQLPIVQAPLCHVKKTLHRQVVVLDEAIVVRNEGLRNFIYKQHIRGHGLPLFSLIYLLNIVVH